MNTNLIADGPDKELCDAVFAHLMTLRPECRADGIETYPEFSEPPWQEVDAAEHRLLLQELLRYAQIIEVPNVEDGLTDPKRYWQIRADEFLAQGGKMLVWRTGAIAAGVDGKPLRKMVELVHYLAVEPNPCPGPTTKGFRRETFIVDDAMQGPAPDVNPDLARLLAGGAVVLYRSELIRINSYFVGRMTGNICYFSRQPK